MYQYHFPENMDVVLMHKMLYHFVFTGQKFSFFVSLFSICIIASLLSITVWLYWSSASAKKLLNCLIKAKFLENWIFHDIFLFLFLSLPPYNKYWTLIFSVVASEENMSWTNPNNTELEEEDRRRPFWKSEKWSSFTHDNTEIMIKTYTMSLYWQSILHCKYVLNGVFPKYFWRGLSEKCNFLILFS